MRKIFITLAIIIACLIPANLIALDGDGNTPPKVLNAKVLALQFANAYHVSYKEMAKTIECESDWDNRSTGDHGLANGLTQFHEDTFNRWAKEKGEVLDYHSDYDQLKLMAWAFSKGYQRSWTCHTKFFGV